MGEGAIHSPGKPKELFRVEGATHVGHYYKPEYVAPAVAQLLEFFQVYLRD